MGRYSQSRRRGGGAGAAPAPPSAASISSAEAIGGHSLEITMTAVVDTSTLLPANFSISGIPATSIDVIVGSVFGAFSAAWDEEPHGQTLDFNTAAPGFVSPEAVVIV